MRNRPILLSIVLFCACALAQAQTIEIKGYAIGGDFDNAKSGPWHKCEETHCLAMKIGKPMPLALSSFAGVDTSYFLVGARHKATIDRIEAHFDSAGYSIVKAALSDKYGAPAAVDTTPVQNKFGAAFTNEIAKWTAPNGDQIKLEKFSANLKTSAVTALSAEALARQTESTKAAMRAAVKDL